MPKRIRLRTLTPEEKAEIQRLVASRKEPIRLVQRARIISAMDADPNLTAGEAGLRAGFRSDATGPMWVKRFNEEGLAGLQDRSPSSRAQTDPQPGSTQCANQPSATEAAFVGIPLRVVDIGTATTGLQRTPRGPSFRLHDLDLDG